MADTAATPQGDARSPHAGRWWQLVIGVICMSMIANLQYGWTLFVTPMDATHHWGRPAIQVAFTIFILTETWLLPVEGYVVDRFGPRVVVVVAALFVAGSWVINSFAQSLPMLYFGAVVGGIGAGSVYGTSVGNALKWFPDRRGLAAGLTAMGFGAGSALTVFPIAAMIKADGYEAAFFRFGLVQGIVVLLLGLFLAAPPAGYTVAAKKGAAPVAQARDHTPGEMARTPTFWVMYLMFVMMSTGGLLATAQLTPIANDYRIADIPVSLMGLTFPALTFALSIDRVMNGISRPLFGWVSDHLGRENTMALTFALEGVAIVLLDLFGKDPTAFVLLTALVFLAWGQIYSIFPATCADTFGRKYAAANYGLLYTAKGMSSLLVPLSSLIAVSTGSWRTVFLGAAAMNFIAAAMAHWLLRPLRGGMKPAA